MSLISTFEITEQAIERSLLNNELKNMFKKKLDKFYLYKLRTVSVLTYYLIKDNKDKISKDFMTFVLKRELRIDDKFDINSFNSESEIFKSNLNPTE